MNHEPKIFNLGKLQSNHNKASKILKKELMSLVDEFKGNRKLLPKYQIFELFKSLSLDDGVARIAGNRKSIEYEGQETLHLIPDSPDNLSEIIDICVDSILSHTSYKVCQTVIIYDQFSKMERFAIILKKPIPQKTNIGGVSLSVIDNEILYDFSHPKDKLPLAI